MSYSGIWFFGAFLELGIWDLFSGFARTFQCAIVERVSIGLVWWLLGWLGQATWQHCWVAFIVIFASIRFPFCNFVLFSA